MRGLLDYQGVVELAIGRECCRQHFCSSREELEFLAYVIDNFQRAPRACMFDITLTAHHSACNSSHS
jgi:hypothetical protein